MIHTKEDLKRYLAEDKKEMGITRRFPIPFGDYIWKYEIALRKHEYYLNTRKSKLALFYYQRKHQRLSYKLGIQIGTNVFDEGLHINHFGLVVVSDKAKIGKHCDIHQGVNIGGGLDRKAPTIGDDCWIGPGAKLYGDIKLGNGVMVGANAVVTKSFEEDFVTLGGVPAKIIKRSGKPLPPEREAHYCRKSVDKVDSTPSK